MLLSQQDYESIQLYILRPITNQEGIYSYIRSVTPNVDTQDLLKYFVHYYLIVYISFMTMWSWLYLILHEAYNIYDYYKELISLYMALLKLFTPIEAFSVLGSLSCHKVVFQLFFCQLSLSILQANTVLFGIGFHELPSA